MSRWGRSVLALGVAAVLGGCTQLGMFEDVGADPHPPSVEFVSVFEALTVTVNGAQVKQLVPLAFDGTAYTVRTGITLQVRLAYADIGGDVDTFGLMDRDGAISPEEFSPAAPDLNGDGTPDTDVATPQYFRGTRGEVDLIDVKWEAKQGGVHRVQFWAVDSHGSRSEKGEFLLRLAL